MDSPTKNGTQTEPSKTPAPLVPFPEHVPYFCGPLWMIRILGALGCTEASTLGLIQSLAEDRAPGPDASDAEEGRTTLLEQLRFCECRPRIVKQKPDGQSATPESGTQFLVQGASSTVALAGPVLAGCVLWWMPFMWVWMHTVPPPNPHMASCAYSG